MKQVEIRPVFFIVVFIFLFLCAAYLFFLVHRDETSETDEVVLKVSASPSQSPSPSYMPICNATSHGRHFAVDERGWLCPSTDLTTQNCCRVDSFNVASCASAPCFDEHELCVVCCARVANLSFNWCLQRCRTSSRSPILHCYKQSSPSPLARPEPSPKPTPGDLIEWKR
jgi:hypothetical protein